MNKTIFTLAAIITFGTSVYFGSEMQDNLDRQQAQKKERKMDTSHGENIACIKDNTKGSASI